MITGDHDKLVEIAKFNVCSVHKTPLEVAWYNKQWTLRCDANGGHYPDAVTKNPSLTQMYKQGTLLDGPIKDNIERRERRKAMSKNSGVKAPLYSLIPQTDLGTGEQLPQERLDTLVKYARKYKLDPYRSHVVLMYGKPYITIDGYLYYARSTGKTFSLESRPMTTEEYDNYKLGPTDTGWLAKLHILDTGEEYTGVGIVTYREQTEPSKHDPNVPAHPVVANNPQLLCQKRAEWQALRRGIPIGGS